MTDQITHGIQASNLADILERVLDKGIVIAGDILIKLADPHNQDKTVDMLC